MSVTFEAKFQILVMCLIDVVTNVILSRYEDNPLNNNKVIANNSNIQAHYTVHYAIQGQ